MSSPPSGAVSPRSHRQPPDVRRTARTARTARVALLPLAMACAMACAMLTACGDDRGGRRTTPANGANAMGGQGVRTDQGVVLTDDGGRTLRLDRPARRVISLIPSVNETLVAIGATDRLVGRTRYDVAPEIAALPSVGGGIDPSIESIIALRPDVVIGWENDKRRGVADRLDALGVPFLSLRTQDTTDMFRGIVLLGALTGADSRAAALATRLRADFDDVRGSVAGRPRRSVMYVVFDDPASTAGPGTFISQVIGVAGGRSLFDDLDQLWPTVSLEEVVRRDPDVVVLPVDDTTATAAAAAVDALRRRAGWRDVRAVREGRVATVPTNLTSRPGPHLSTAARVLRDAIHNPIPTTR